MCSVSMIMDYGRRDFWPDWNRQIQQPMTLPYTGPFPFPAPMVPPLPEETDEQKLREFLKLYEAAKRYDEQTAQPNCEDPMKMQVLERILERLDQIEATLGDGGTEI